MLRRCTDERGQALIIVVGALTVVFVIGALAVDVGLWLAERRAAQTVADFSALAASQELPGDDAEAVANAHSYAGENGYSHGIGGVEVSVSLLCTNQLPSPPAGLCSNGAAVGPSGCPTGGGCDAVRVTIKKPASHLFTSLLGLGDIEVTAGASAVAGVSAAPQSTLLLFDASGVMLKDCTNPPHYDNDGCFLKHGKEAAHGLVDILTVADGGSLVGYLPYNNCYKPPGNWLCVPDADVIAPTVDAGTLHAAIDRTSARALINLCLPLLRATQIVDGGREAVVFLSNGDNVAYHDENWIAVLPGCRPTSRNAVDLGVPRCQPPHAQERELDIKAWQAAEQLKQLGADVYVVGLDVCGNDDGRTRDDGGYCSGIGDEAHDDIADQRLLKCIASSPEQYYRVSDPRDLALTFTDVATTIANRGLLE